VSPNLVILNSGCFKPGPGSFAYNIIRDISHFLGVSREKLGIKPPESSSPAGTRSSVNLPLPDIIDLISEQSDSTNSDMGGESKLSNTKGRSHSPRVKTLYSDTSSAIKRTVLIRRSSSEGSTTGSSNGSLSPVTSAPLSSAKVAAVPSSSSGSGGGGSGGGSSSLHPTSRDLEGTCGNEVDDEEEEMKRGGATMKSENDTGTGAAAVVDPCSSDESSEWETYDSTQWETAAADDSSESSLQVDSFGLPTGHASSSCSSSSGSCGMANNLDGASVDEVLRKGLALNTSTARKRTNISSKGSSKKPLGAIVSTSSSSVLASSSPSTVSSMPTKTTARRKEGSVTKGAVPGAAKEAKNSSLKCSNTAHSGRGGLSKTQSLSIVADIAIANPTNGADACEEDVDENDLDSDGFSKLDTIRAQWAALMDESDDEMLLGEGDDAASSVASCDVFSKSEESDGGKKRAKRQRTYPKSFQHTYQEEEGQVKRKGGTAGATSGAVRKGSRPPLPPTYCAAPGGARGGGRRMRKKGTGCEGAGSSSGAGAAAGGGGNKRSHSAFNAPTAHVVSKNKFVGVIGHGKRFRAFIDMGSVLFSAIYTQYTMRFALADRVY
jgi:hypothetical protein